MSKHRFTIKWNIRCVIIILFASLVAGPAWADDAQEEKNKANAAKKKEMVDAWQRIFGPVDFSLEEPVGLFDIVLYVWPQPAEALQEMGDNQLTAQIFQYNAKWAKHFFKEAYRPNVEKVQPNRYFLGTGHEKDLLEYRWQAEGVKFRTIESAGVTLLMPDPASSGLKPEAGIAGKDLAEFLLKVLDLPYPTADELSKDFKLPATLKVGDVFTNAKKRHPLMAAPYQWEKFVVGFVGTNGVNIMCLKIEHNPHSPRMGFSFNPHWLEGQLLKPDGKTPLNRPAEPAQ